MNLLVRLVHSPCMRPFLPALRWFPAAPGQIRADVWAGIALGLLVVPQSLAYAHLAGMPPVTGLYAALLPMIIGALLGWCGPLTTGPVAMTSILTAAVLSAHATVGDPRWITLAAMLALMVGIIRIVLGLLRASVLVSLLSHPVMLGFTAAAAIIIAESQIAELLGIPIGRGTSFLTHVAAMATHLGDSHLPTLAMGLGSLIALLLGKRWLGRIPVILPVAAVATAISWGTGYSGHTVGALPSGLPPFGFPEWDWHMARKLIPDALWITLIGFMEVLTVTKSVAARTRQVQNLDGELISQGAASIAAGLTGGFPVSGSLSRSAFNLNNGARTGMSSMVAAVLVLATLLVCGPILAHMPLATLAAAIIAAVVSLIDVAAIRRAFRVHYHDGLAVVCTAVATLAFAPRMVDGILAGAVLAIGLFFHRTMRPRVVRLGQHADGTLRDCTLHDLPPIDPRIVALRMDGRLYFANSSHFERAVIANLAITPAARWVVLAGDGLNEIDATGCETLTSLIRRLGETGIGFAFFDLKGPVQATLERAGIIAQIDPALCFRTPEAAIVELTRRMDDAADPQGPATASG